MIAPIVCRDFDVKIMTKDHGFSSDMHRVIAEPVPNKAKSVSDFLDDVGKVEYLSHHKNLVLSDRLDMGTSRFFYAIHCCFANHYPLALSPEVLQYLILHEVAVCVKQNPETYRHLFTTSDKKEIIKVRHDGLVKGHASPWPETMPMFEKALGKVIPSLVLGHALPRFSTDTPITRASSMVAFMDAASPYYDYRVMTKCGIPKIRLLGEAEDYVKLVLSCLNLQALFKEHLGIYFDHLIPVLQRLAIQARGGEYDNSFWSSIYKHLSGSGTDAMTGWLTAFLNYEVKDDNVFAPKNAKYYDWEAGVKQREFGHGFDRSGIPSHVSKVDFLWEYYSEEIQMEFIGGILSVENIDGYVTPGMGFAVAHKKGK